MIRFRKAILLIHGFAGGTYDEESLAFKLELDKKLDVYSFTLPGHDKSIIIKVKKEDWVNACEEKINLLINSGYKEIYVIGHSMGGVLASLLATRHPEVKKLVLVAPAFEALDSKDGSINIFGSIKKAPQIIKTYSKDEVISRMSKMPIPMIFEFQKLIKENQDLPPKIKCPTLLIHGTNDQIVPISSSEKIYGELKVPVKKFLVVEGSTHDMFKGKKKDVVMNEIHKFLRNTPNEKENKVKI